MRIDSKIPELTRLLGVCALAMLALLLAGCAARPSLTIAQGELLDAVDFDASYEWENYANVEQGVNFRVEDGAYRAEARDRGFTWVLNSTAHTDVVIQVDAQQVSTFRNNAYGLMCRAAPTNNGDGYYFLISGDGYYTIRRGATDEVPPLIPWTRTDAVQQDQAINRIRIACVGEYLSLTVNGQFVAETTDDRYHRGFAGLSAAVVADGDADIRFDELRIWEGRAAGDS
ncbi:MAG: DUF1080 domain-containing protein [Pleurocapsa minor GSE-CHR-MK-17-07R]|jgi:hypothetical protein|nr:DUF1080 domain-containing protein [Pleurocapsa minor GSE-CHR-MK 17-07R]